MFVVSVLLLIITVDPREWIKHTNFFFSFFGNKGEYMISATIKSYLEKWKKKFHYELFHQKNQKSLIRLRQRPLQARDTKEDASRESEKNQLYINHHLPFCNGPNQIYFLRPHDLRYLNLAKSWSWAIALCTKQKKPYFVHSLPFFFFFKKKKKIINR